MGTETTYLESPGAYTREFLGKEGISILGNPDSPQNLLNSLRKAILSKNPSVSSEALVLFYLITNMESDPLSNSFVSEYYHPYNKLWQVLESVRTNTSFPPILDLLKSKFSSNDLYEKVVHLRVSVFIFLSMYKTLNLQGMEFPEKIHTIVFEEYEKIKAELEEGDIVIDSYKECYEKSSLALMLEFLTGGVSLNPKIVRDDNIFDFPMGNFSLCLFSKKMPVLQANSGHLRGSALILFSFPKGTSFSSFSSCGFSYEVSSGLPNKEKWLGYQYKDENQMMLKIKYFSVYDLIHKLSVLESLFNESF